MVCPACGTGTTECEDYEDAAMSWNKRVIKSLPAKKGAGDCPFCGGKAALTTTNPKKCFLYWVKCRDCLAQTFVYGTKQEVIEAWNKRAESNAELTGTAAELYCLLKEIITELRAYGDVVKDDLYLLMTDAEQFLACIDGKEQK